MKIEEINALGKICGIYKITSPSNKIYIGSSSNIKKRWNSYFYLKCKPQPKLYNSLKKYGSENHTYEIIEECEFEALYERERYYQELYDCLGVNSLNCNLVETNLKFESMREAEIYFNYKRGYVKKNFKTKYPKFKIVE